MTTAEGNGPTLRPRLEGDFVTSIDLDHSVLIDTAGGWSIRIEGDCTLHRSGAAPIEVTEERFSMLDSAIAPWVGQALEGLEYLPDGSLIVACGDARLAVPPSRRYEAWGLGGPNQETIVSLPCGEITSWDGV